MPSTQKQGHAWIVIGDLHDDISRLAQIKDLAQADGILVSGDLTNMGGVPEAARMLTALRSPGLPVLAQIGNMDRAEIDAWLTAQGCNLHLQVVELVPDLAVFGVGGSTITPFGTPSEFDEAEYAAWMAASWQQARRCRHRVLISHNPPRDTACDLTSGGLHVGSQAVRDFILQCQPDVCVCGHIHESKAVDRLGRTVIVNPGLFADGGFAFLSLRDGELSCCLRGV